MEEIIKTLAAVLSTNYVPGDNVFPLGDITMIVNISVEDAIAYYDENMEPVYQVGIYVNSISTYIGDIKVYLSSGYCTELSYLLKSKYGF